MINLLDFFFYTIKDILVCITMILACTNLLGGKVKKNIPAGILIGLLLVSNAAFFIFFFKGTQENRLLFLDSVSSLAFILSVSFFIKELKYSKRIWFLLVCVLTMEMFFSLFSPYLPSHLFVEAIIYIILYALLLFVLLYAVKSTTVNFMPQVFDTMPKWIIIALLGFDLTGYYKTFGESSDWYNVLYIASTIGVIICVLFFVLKIFTLTYQQNEILRQFHEQKNYSEKMLKGDENLRRFRHDYRNHMIVINAYLENGNTDSARSYLNSINASISDTVNKISTGNFVADAILNNKTVVAAQNGNRIQFSGQVPADGIADEDICTVLANAVDNALEATQKLQSESVIHVEAAIRNNMFLLNISNPVAEKVKIGKNNTIKTTKKNKSEHGIGTKNIQKIVKKYNGALTLDCTDMIFTFSIRLHLQAADNYSVQQATPAT